MDEYGEFIDDEPNLSEGGDFFGNAPVVAEEEPEPPGLTDEALHLLEVAWRGALPRPSRTFPLCPAGGFGLPDLPQAGHRCRVGRLDRQS